eukprot:SM002771S10262  [mRNA]  locus=s2771:70:1592:- [translate_table: standard]
MVFNRVTYPNFVAFLEAAGVAAEPSDMSFAVSLPGAVEWGSRGLAGLFAQRANVLRPAFWAMLADMLRFHAHARRYLQKLEARGSAAEERGVDGIAGETLGRFLELGRYSQGFRDFYLVPVCASIWSAPSAEVLGFSAACVLSFLRNHHMLQIFGRPQWLTIKGRSRTYVDKIVEGLQRAGSEVRTGCRVTSVAPAKPAAGAGGGRKVRVEDALGGSALYDAAVVAVHAPDALALLGEAAGPCERDVLGAFRYGASDVVLHGDTALMPRNRAAWSAWNFLGCPGGRVAVTYWLNLLQVLC